MRRFAKRKLRVWLHALLHTHDSAERTSLAFALGVFIAFLPPIPWFHTLFALTLAFVFRLNRLATILGTYVNTPFTILPLLAAETSVGLAILGGEEPPDVTFRQLQNWQGWKDAAIELKPFLAPTLLGCVILGLTAATIAYFTSLKLILAYRRRAAHAALAHQAELELAVQESPASASVPTSRVVRAGGDVPAGADLSPGEGQDSKNRGSA